MRHSRVQDGRRGAALSAGLASIAALSLGGPAFVQSADDTVLEATELEPIIVGARRRDEELLDVPVSATVLDGQTL
ncbi:MAG: hypothetical protein AAGC86_11945 [Pseudomonadota bacterium]